MAELARPVRYGPAPPAGAAPKAILLLLAGTIFAVYTGPSGSQVWPAHWDGHSPRAETEAEAGVDLTAC